MLRELLDVSLVAVSERLDSEDGQDHREFVWISLFSISKYCNVISYVKYVNTVVIVTLTCPRSVLIFRVLRH